MDSWTKWHKVTAQTSKSCIIKESKEFTKGTTMTSVFLVFEIQYECDDYESFEIPMLDSDHTKTFLTLKEAEDYLEKRKDNEMPRLLELAKKWEFKKTTYDELYDRFGLEHELEIKELVLTK